MFHLEVVDFERCVHGELAKVAFYYLHIVATLCCEKFMHGSLTRVEQDDVIQDINLLEC